MYNDEGSNSYTIIGNDYLSNINWYNPNQGCATCGVHTGNNTLEDNFVYVSPDEVNFPNGSGNFNDTFINNLNVPGLNETSEAAQRVAYRAGILPGNRGSRPISNPDSPDSYLSRLIQAARYRSRPQCPTLMTSTSLTSLLSKLLLALATTRSHQQAQSHGRSWRTG